MLRILGTGSEGTYAKISTCRRQETANVLDVNGNIPTSFPRPCIVSKTNGQALQDRTQKSHIALKIIRRYPKNRRGEDPKDRSK
jgi:hypothetical protein